MVSKRVNRKFRASKDTSRSLANRVRKPSAGGPAIAESAANMGSHERLQGRNRSNELRPIKESQVKGGSNLRMPPNESRDLILQDSRSSFGEKQRDKELDDLSLRFKVRRNTNQLIFSSPCQGFALSSRLSGSSAYWEEQKE